ncbi:MAG: hypothetical protein JEZ09_17780 [Salinivirgaceae bacterium]|nr:hypothetical protein [Salinivirgaceae bacterium]
MSGLSCFKEVYMKDLLDDNKIEELADDQFKSASDDGLFPNYNDKDIWMSGFVDGYKYDEISNGGVEW